MAGPSRMSFPEQLRWMREPVRAVWSWGLEPAGADIWCICGIAAHVILCAPNVGEALLF